MTMASVVVAAPRLIVRSLGGQMTLFDPATRECYRLDAVGSRIWELITEPTRVERVRDALVLEYDVTREICERDVLAVLEELASAGLVDLMNTEVPPEQAAAAG